MACGSNFSTKNGPPGYFGCRRPSHFCQAQMILGGPILVLGVHFGLSMTVFKRAYLSFCDGNVFMDSLLHNLQAHGTLEHEEELEHNRGRGGEEGRGREKGEGGEGLGVGQ